jgi:hypothetical protein
MFRRVPSLAKLERLIGYRPTTSLETIIDAVAADMRPRVLKVPAAEITLPPQAYKTALPTHFSQPA